MNKKKQRTEYGGRNPLDWGQRAKVATKAVGVGLPGRKVRSIDTSSRHEDGCHEGEERDQGASLLHCDGWRGGVRVYEMWALKW